MKKLFSLLLILSLCLLTGCGAQETKTATPAQEPATAAAEKSPLQTAFEEEKSFALVKADLPAEGAALGGMPISLSPDGNTWLWKVDDSLFVVRNGQEALPMKAAPDRGIGDPYGTLEEMVSALGWSLPGNEGVAWSPDSRLALMLSPQYAMQLISKSPMGLMLLDAETGEVFLAAAYETGIKSDNFGAAYQGAFDRSGKYLYYVDSSRANGSTPYAFKRCDLSTFKTEILSADYYPCSYIDMVEDKDGNWLVMGSSEESRGMDNVVRLFQANGGLKEKTTLQVEGGKWRLLQAGVSADTGWGLGYGRSQTAGMSSNLANGSIDGATDLAKMSVQSSLVFEQVMRLIRITPEGIDADHYWYIISDSEDGSGARAAVLSDEVTAWLRMVYEQHNLVFTDDEQKARLTAYAEELNTSLILDVQSVCLSPDGHYALLSASGQQERRPLDLYRFYLLDLETMALRPVDAPEGLCGAHLVFTSPYSQKFAPCMEWNDDGTLLIWDEDSRGVQAWHLAWQ